MIVEHVVEGLKETSLHDFVVTQTGLDITVTAGTYTRANVEKCTFTMGATVTVTPPVVTTHYEVWVTKTGVSVLSHADGQIFGSVSSPIDRLAWFTIPGGVTSLDSVEIHVVRMVEV